MTALGIRDHNPLNLVWRPQDRWQGLAMWRDIPIVLPDLILLNHGNCASADAEFLGKNTAYSIAAGRIPGTDVLDLGAGELASDHASSMLGHHFLVFLMGGPSKVLNAVVSGISIEVCNIAKEIGIWQKCNCDQAMHKIGFTNAIVINDGGLQIGATRPSLTANYCYWRFSPKNRDESAALSPASKLAARMRFVITVARNLLPHG